MTAQAERHWDGPAKVSVDGWPLRRAAERFQVSPTTAQPWPTTASPARPG
ncbi:hypothetical protein [Streptomyces sp. NPDC002215]